MARFSFARCDAIRIVRYHARALGVMVLRSRRALTHLGRARYSNPYADKMERFRRKHIIYHSIQQASEHARNRILTINSPKTRIYSTNNEMRDVSCWRLL